MEMFEQPMGDGCIEFAETITREINGVAFTGEVKLARKATG